MRGTCHITLLLLFTLGAAAQTNPKPQIAPLGPHLGAWQARCERALLTPLPAEAQTAAPISGNLDSMGFYYGLNNQPRDYVQARRVAWAERAAYPTHPGGSAGFSGPLLLAMIYANGLGVPRNTALALRMACEATAYPNNIGPEELDHLQSILDSTATPPPQFELCSVEPSDVGTRQLCDTLAFNQQNQRWSDEIDAFGQTWPPNQKAALASLKKAASEFFRFSSIWEHAAILPATPVPDAFHPANRLLQEDLLARLHMLESGSPPTPTRLTPAQADAQLNTQYRSFDDHVRATMPRESDTPGIANERKIEHLWLNYRDAFLALVKLRYPQHAAAWSSQLTADRTATLQKLTAELAPIPEEAKPWLAACARYRETPLPAEFRVESSERASLPCNAYRSYYGLGVPVDYSKARSCAIRERADLLKNGSYSFAFNGKDDPASYIGDELNGTVILTMLYANGKGTPRNTPLALRFACESIDNEQIGPPNNFAEADERAGIIPELLKTVQSGASIDMCGYVPGVGRLETECDLISTIEAKQKRDSDIASLAAQCNPEQRAAFLHLVDALHAYYKAHDEQETSVMPHFLDSGGWDGIHAERETEFIKDMRRFESGQLPSYTATEDQAADRSLNTAFQKVVDKFAEEEKTVRKEVAATGNSPSPSSESEHDIGEEPTAATLRSTEQLWLVYRDAWANFGHLRYPQTSGESWRTWITLQHTKDLQDPCFFEAPCAKQ